MGYLSIALVYASDINCRNSHLNLSILVMNWLLFAMLMASIYGGVLREFMMSANIPGPVETPKV